VKEHANKAGLCGVSVVFYNQKGTVRFDNYYHESYFRASNSTSGSNGGIEDFTLTNSTQLNSSTQNDRENTIFPIEGILTLLDTGY
jgi:hypothetical protein